ncbi:uncharacterized protein [Rhodnius prolixus]
MKLLFHLIALAAVTSVSSGIFFQSATLGEQIQGDRQWQDFDQYGISNEDRYTYQHPGYQQLLDYQHQSYQRPSESLRPSQTLFQATQHLLQPAQQILQSGHQHLFHHNPQQTYNEPAENAYQSPLQVLPNYQLFNGFQGSQLSQQNNVPFVVKFVENQALMPIRAVYSLPPLLEKLVQRVQGYYSVYNAPEQLTLDRPLFKPTPAAPTADLFITDITESSEVSDSVSESSTASPVQQISILPSTTEEQKIKPTTEAPQTTTKSTETATTSTTSKSQKITASASTEAPETIKTTTTNKTPETSTTSKTTTTSSNKISTLTVVELTPTTSVAEQETTDVARETTTGAQTEQTTDASNVDSTSSDAGI